MEKNTETCEWCDDYDGVWQTTCGNAWQFNNGGPINNKMKFCPYCGKSLIEKRIEADD